MAQPADQLLTAEEFMRLPDPPNGGRLELIDGKVTVVAPVGGSHAYRSNRIWRYLDDFALAHDLGWATSEGSYQLQHNPDRVVTPDVAFVRADRLEDGVLPDSIVPVPPDLAVEVKSPTDRERDIMVKIERYFQAGTPVVWVVRPDERTVSVCRPEAQPIVRREDDALTSEDAGFGIEGFELPVAAIFAV